MTGFQVVILWSDVLIWLLVAAGVGFGVLIARNPPLLAAWRRVGANRVGMASATAIYLAAPVRHSVSALLWIEVLSFTLLVALAPYLPWRRAFVPGREMDERVRESALLEFYSSGLHRTRDASGVLIYLSLWERRVVVLGDSGIHAKVGEASWDGIRDMIISGIREGKACAGICRAIEACGRTLAEHFPRKADDVNELSDRVIDRTSPNRS